MRLGGEPVGRWGIALLAAAGVVGVALAWHGWAGREAGAVPGLGTARTGAAAASASASAAPSGSGPAASAGRSSAAQSPSASAGKAGPLLRTEPFASFAFQVWPGAASAAARQALIGLSVSVRKTAAGLSVTAGVNGQPPAQPRLYRGGTRVYVVEVSLGDDSGNADYNLGDDGIVVTDAQGRIIE